MRILLDVPGSWFVEPLRSGLTHYRDPAHPGVRILVTTLVPLPDDVRGWRRRELHALVPEGHELRVVREKRAYTRIGWPIKIVEADCLRGTKCLERWVAVFYQPGDRIGVALARGPRSALGVEAVGDLVGILATAKPSARLLEGDEAAGLEGALSGPWQRRKPVPLPN
jgi:hypothetical protein